VISEIQIRNFKSIRRATLRPGRVTVLIGENGSGKSNVLEAIAFASCATTNRLDDDILFYRGVRVTDEKWMISAFPESEIEEQKRKIAFLIKGPTGESLDFFVMPPIQRDDKSLSKWRIELPPIDPELEKTILDIVHPKIDEMARQLRDSLEEQKLSDQELKDRIQAELSTRVPLLLKELQTHVKISPPLSELSSKLGLADFLIYAPENSTLRSQPQEGATQPLGTKGEGLFRLVQSFSEEASGKPLKELQSRLRLFGWFDQFVCADDAVSQQAKLNIHDRWLAEDKSTFDQRSANEGFLFVLFYFTLLISSRTPNFFAIDNIDTALNPKLCSTLMMQIVELAKKHDKQVICTTHNPAILDGLNLRDDEQRLYLVRRDSEGQTILRRIDPPEPQKKGELPVRLSEAFIRGLIGGLPEHF